MGNGNRAYELSKDVAPTPAVSIFTNCTVCVAEAGAYRVVAAGECVAIECGTDLFLRVFTGPHGELLKQWVLTIGECDVVIVGFDEPPPSLQSTRQADLFDDRRDDFDRLLSVVLTAGRSTRGATVDKVGNPAPQLLRAWRRPAVIVGGGQ